MDVNTSVGVLSAQDRHNGYAHKSQKEPAEELFCNEEEQSSGSGSDMSMTNKHNAHKMQNEASVVSSRGGAPGLRQISR